MNTAPRPATPLSPALPALVFRPFHLLAGASATPGTDGNEGRRRRHVDFACVKLLHIGVAALSGLTFFVRGIWKLRKPVVLQQHPVRIPPHLNDTVLTSDVARMALVTRQFMDTQLAFIAPDTNDHSPQMPVWQRFPAFKCEQGHIARLK